MWKRSLIVFAIMFVSGCGGAPGRKSTPPASAGVTAFISILRSDDPEPAYALLAAEVRDRLSYDEFAIQWKETARERADQAAALEEGLKGDPNLGERASIGYSDGKSVHLAREGNRWLLESAVVTRTHAGRPHDAVKIFAEALSERDYEAVTRILTTRRRDGIDKQIETFVVSLLAHLEGEDNTIETIGTDRAELRWDHEGRRYKIVLRKEGDEWRVDDIYLRPVPPKDDD